VIYNIISRIFARALIFSIVTVVLRNLHNK